jgi:hypothetical protein
MKNHPETNLGTNLDPIDRILSTDEQLVPSSGFASAVMERVRVEAAAPPPIPFPWRRALPGILLVIAVFGWCAFELIRYLPQALRHVSVAAPRLPVFATRDLTQAGWVALGGVLALLSWWFPSRLTRRSRIL